MCCQYMVMRTIAYDCWCLIIHLLLQIWTRVCYQYMVMRTIAYDCWCLIIHLLLQIWTRVLSIHGDEDDCL